MFKKVLLVLVAALLVACSSETPTQTPNGQYFVVQVGAEQFTMFVTDPSTIQLAMENLQKKNIKFPSGRIAFGSGGYNRPYDWHYVPETVRMVDLSAEVCDGLPSYVNTHLNDFLTAGYCPWSGKIIKVGL